MAGGLLLALPARADVQEANVAPDYNNDGAVDFCDCVLFVSDFYSNNLRSDFNSDGVVNLDDTALFLSQYCSGPPKSAVAGAATIGVYFDAAGTITQLVNVPAFTFVDFYVVAHGLTDPSGIGGFTFKVNDDSNAFVATSTPPANFFDIPIANGDDEVSYGSSVACLGPGNGVVLSQMKLFYQGLDTTLEVVGLNQCQAPSVSPSFVSCPGDSMTCDWTYFSYGASNGRAYLTSGPVSEEGVSWSDVKALFR